MFARQALTTRQITLRCAFKPTQLLLLLCLLTSFSGMAWGEYFVPRLLKQLKDKQETVRHKAAIELVEKLQAKHWRSRYHGASVVRSVAHNTTPKQLQVLRKLLYHKDEKLRLYATYIMSAMGTRAKAAYPDLLKLLQHEPNHITRSVVVSTLGQCGCKSMKIFSALAKAVNDKKIEKLAIVRGLLALSVRIGRKSVPTLLGLMTHRDPKVRMYVVDALGHLGKHAHLAIPALLKALKDTDFNVQGRAVLSLKTAGYPTAKLLPILIDKLSLDNSAVQAVSVSVLEQLKTEAAPAAVALTQLLDRCSWNVCYGASKVLKKIGPKVIPLLVKALESPKANKRLWAADTLYHFKAKARAGIPQLTKLLTDKNKDVREKAVLALGSMGPIARSALPALIRLLDDPNSRIRWRTINALHSFGKLAVPAIPGLIKALSARSRFEYNSAARTLGVIGHPSAIPALLKAFRHSDNWQGEQASKAVALIGPKAIPALRKGLTSPDWRVRQYTLRAFHLMDPKKPSVLAMLIKALKDPARRVRYFAVKALGHRGKGAAEAVPALLQAWKSDDKRVTAEIAKTLGNIGPQVPGVIPALAKALHRTYYSTREKALRALAKMGPAAAPALPEVIRVLKGPGDLYFRRSIVGYMAQLGPVAKNMLPSVLRMLKASRNRQSVYYQFIANLGKHAKSAFHLVGDMLRHSKPGQQRVALYYLLSLKQHGAPLLPVIFDLFNKGDYSTKELCLRVLGSFGPKHPKVRKLLQASLKHAHPSIRNAAKRTLASIQKQHQAKHAAKRKPSTRRTKVTTTPARR